MPFDFSAINLHAGYIKIPSLWYNWDKDFLLTGQLLWRAFSSSFWMIYLGYFQRSDRSPFILHFVFWVNFGFYFYSWPLPGLLGFFSLFLFLLCFWKDYFFNVVFSGAVCSVFWCLLGKYLCGVRSRSQNKLHSELVPQIPWLIWSAHKPDKPNASSSYFLLHHRNWNFAIN